MDMNQMMIDQHIAIKENLEILTAAVKSYSAMFEQNASSQDLSMAGQISQCHVKMLESVKQMQSAVYGPLNMIMLHFEECLRSSSLRSLIEMGVCDALSMDGKGMPIAELAAKLQVDVALLVRLMRVVVPTFFTESSPEVYAHTANSRVFVVPALKANFKMMYDEICVASVRMPEFLKKNQYQNPDSLTNNPYTYAHDTKGLGIFDFLLKHPVRFKNFNDSMEAKSAQTLQPYNLFPFRDTFQNLDVTDKTVLLVDVGGGKGQATTAIRQLCSGIEGTMILQDQQQVLDGISDSLPGVVKMAHNFFEPQPIKGALIYYIHRCLHDWPEQECVKILKNIADAMEPRRSRLLVSEIVMPVGPVDMQTAWSDVNMMTFSGIERTEKQWRALFEKAGVDLVKLYSEEGRSNHCVIEAVPI